MSFNLWWAQNDGMSGHVWLSVDDMLALREEMAAQGMLGDGAIPPEKLAPPERETITADEVENALARASEEPRTLDGAKLWRDWLAFMDGARTRGGILVRSG
jgi:hypothetical protein